MSDKLSELGIPPHEITPSVSIAVNGLIDHVNQLNTSLQNVKGQLESLQSLVDVDAVNNAVANRRAFIKRLNWSIAMSKRYSGPTTIIVYSINDFDAVSKTYGYQASANLANYVGDYIAHNVRDTDFVARTDENQFATIMYFAESDDVRAKADRMANNLRSLPMRWNNSVINASLTYGVHAITAADDPETALMAAISSMHVSDNRQKFEQINFKA